MDPAKDIELDFLVPDGIDGKAARAQKLAQRTFVEMIQMPRHVEGKPEPPVEASLPATRVGDGQNQTPVWGHHRAGLSELVGGVGEMLQRVPCRDDVKLFRVGKRTDMITDGESSSGSNHGGFAPIGPPDFKARGSGDLQEPSATAAEIQQSCRGLFFAQDMPEALSEAELF